MFSNETAVEINLTSGKTVSLLVDKKLVRRIGEQTQLLVYVAELSDKETTVLLPGEPFQGSRWARVFESELRAA